jgi:hypothetical protein
LESQLGTETVIWCRQFLVLSPVPHLAILVLALLIDIPNALIALLMLEPSIHSSRFFELQSHIKPEAPGIGGN